MALTFAHRGVLVIVLDMTNIDRVMRNDPFVFDGRKVPIPLALSVPLQIMICYAGPDEQGTIRSKSASPDELWRYLTRGWTVTPEDGDTYTKLP